MTAPKDEVKVCITIKVPDLNDDRIRDIIDSVEKSLDNDKLSEFGGTLLKIDNFYADFDALQKLSLEQAEEIRLLKEFLHTECLALRPANVGFSVYDRYMKKITTAKANAGKAGG